MNDIRAITLRQPYPSLVARRIKRWETRSWKTSYRGPLLIHAGKIPHREPVGDWCATERLSDLVIEHATSGGRDYETIEIPAPLGAVVAVAHLTDCIPIVGHGEIPEQPGLFIEDHQTHHAPDARCLWLCKHRSDGAIDTLDRIEDQRPYGHWTPGGWAWQLEDIRRLPEPVPAKGRQRLWRPDPDLAAAVTEGNQP